MALSAADVPNVLQCLQGALNPDVGVQKQAEAVLASLEQRPGFCSCLGVGPAAMLAHMTDRRAEAYSWHRLDSQEIVGNKENDHSARWLASVHFKNTVTRAWRGRLDQRCVVVVLTAAPVSSRSISNQLGFFFGECRGLTAEEKAHLRTKLLQLIEQDDNQVRSNSHACMIWMVRAGAKNPGSPGDLQQHAQPMGTCGVAAVLCCPTSRTHTSPRPRPHPLT